MWRKDANTPFNFSAICSITALFAAQKFITRFSPSSSFVPTPLIYTPFIQVAGPENGGRQLAISDIHGCALTFKALLDKVGLTKNDQLFILGDLINRGPRSSEVVDHILFLMEDGYQVYTLRGNHEEILLHISKTGPTELPLLLSTRNSMDMLNKKGKVKKRFLRFFRSLPYYFVLDDFYLVHAGFNLAAVNPLLDLHAMVWQRPFLLKDELINGRRVVFGHHPRSIGKIRKAVEIKQAGVCIDNGCTHAYMGEGFGALVCLDLNTGEIWRKRNCEERL